MSPTEKRIHSLEEDWTYPDHQELEPLVLALCEIAKGLNRIAICLEKLEPKIQPQQSA